MSDVVMQMPELARMVGDEQEPVKHLVRASRGRSVKIALMGPAGSGKSTLLNALVSAVAGGYRHVQDAGNGFGDKGQRTLAARLIRLLDMALDLVPEEAADMEVNLWDLVGHRTAQELNVMLSGRVRSGELFPEQTDLRKLCEVLQRPVTARDAAHCVIVLVPAGTLDSCAEPPPYIVDAIDVARKYQANTPDVHVLPLILVITKIDEWTGAQGHDRSILLERAGDLAFLFSKAAEWGFQGNMVFPMGFLDSGAVDYADAEDPCVAALKYLLVHATRTSRLFQQDLPLA